MGWRVPKIDGQERHGGTRCNDADDCGNGDDGEKEDRMKPHSFECYHTDGMI